MQLLNRPLSFAFMVAGASQLFVGPASFADLEQMNVRCSTRATSRGLLRTRSEFGRSFSFSQRPAPECTIRSRINLSSASEPSHQKMWSGVQSCEISSTHASIAGLVRLWVPKVSGLLVECLVVVMCCWQICMQTAALLQAANLPKYNYKLSFSKTRAGARYSVMDVRRRTLPGWCTGCQIIFK